MKRTNMKWQRLAPVFVALWMMVLPVGGQNVAYWQAKGGNKRTAMPWEITLEKAEGTWYAVEPSYGVNMVVKGLRVREVDENFKIKQSLKIPKCKRATVAFFRCNGGLLDIVVNCSGKNQMALRHLQVDRQSFTIVGDSLLVSHELGRHDEAYIWVDVPPSGKYIGVVSAVVNQKDGMAAVNAALYDSAVRHLWTHPVQARALSQIATTEEGRIVMGGMLQGEKNEGGTVVEFNTADAGGVSQGHISFAYPLSKLALLNCIDGKVTATALEIGHKSDRASTFYTAGALSKSTTYVGCVAMCYDMKADKPVGTDHYRFCKEDETMFYGVADGENRTVPEVNYLELKKRMETPRGGVALYSRAYVITTAHVGRIRTEEEIAWRMGMMLFSVDTTGKFEWIRAVPHFNRLQAMLKRLPMETDMVERDGTVYLFTNEAENEREDYDPSARLGTELLNSNGSLSMYTFTPDGTVRKQKLAVGLGHRLLAPLRSMGDGRYNLITGKLTGKISEIAIQD